MADHGDISPTLSLAHLIIDIGEHLHRVSFTSVMCMLFGRSLSPCTSQNMLALLYLDHER